MSKKDLIRKKWLPRFITIGIVDILVIITIGHIVEANKISVYPNDWFSALTLTVLFFALFGIIYCYKKLWNIFLYIFIILIPFFILASAINYKKAKLGFPPCDQHARDISNCIKIDALFSPIILILILILALIFYAVKLFYKKSKNSKNRLTHEQIRRLTNNNKTT